MAPCSTEAWPVEGAQAHTKQAVELGGGEGEGCDDKRMGPRGRREDKSLCCFPLPLKAPP